MIKIELTQQERAELLTLHKKTRDKRICDRIKAVIHKSDGWTTRAIAKALLIHEDTVAQHLIDYQQDKLKPANGGSVKKLEEQQEKELVVHLENKIYQSVHPIIEYIAATYQVDYSESSVRNLLKRNGFSYKKPKGCPRKLDKQAQEAFIEHYKQLKAEVDSNEPIIFLDATHPNCETKLTHGWIKKGKKGDKYLATTASRSRVNLIGGLNINEIESTQVSMVETVNADSVLDYLKRLKRQYSFSETIHVILDQAGYHRSNYFKLQVKLLGGIELHYLPPYSPNLNIIERLWKVMNEEVRNNKYFANVSELRTELTEFFTQRLPKMAVNLSKRFADNFQALPEPEGKPVS